jgi:hypothetical protein
MPCWNDPDRPVSLNPLGGTIDDAIDARDLARLRLAVAAFLEAAELALVARDFEQALGEPPGSLVLLDPHRCDDFCRCDGRPPPHKRAN